MGNNKSKKIEKKIFDNIQIIKDHDSICINTDDYFLAVNDLDVSNGIDIIKNLVILSPNTFKNSELNESYIAHAFENKNFFIEESHGMAILNFADNSLRRMNITNNLRVVENPSGLQNAKMDLSQIIIINEELNLKEILEFHKIAIETKVKYFEYQKFPDHIQEVLNNNEFLVIACPISKYKIDNDNNEISQILENSFNSESTNKEESEKIYSTRKKELLKIKNEMVKSIIRSSKHFLDNINIDFGILDYIFAEGITIDHLVDAGMELCVGIEETQELRDKLKAQIFLSLEDINVIALLISAIRCEDDFQNNRVREVDVEDDPAYLYTDEVLGMAIANQIAGTKATFNFKRYDEEKPGILSGLGPMVDDIFAGLIAGCMSKIFEEH
ncbi:phosphatidylglycerophosphatase A [Methanobrevibacter cuticularis]|uniref:Phosphatidylglycerophosphatase A n=1 Tax=Methanobrevibacter cuticularis TaxID=47311 RepID=A0A166F3P7_9EURY|nr:phosphatidylglycerophosphatase A [Methanobrevibacter cuticularis]KZX17283.1 phosphatidylglycerophosphatase A [Methanobrevibacter cuticularis]